MFGWFSWKNESKKIREDTKSGFEFVKKDISSLTGWIKHLDSEKNLQKRDLEGIKEDLSSIKVEIEAMKNVLSIMNELKPKQLFKTNRQMFDKQTPVYAVQTGVQTGVQTPNLDQFSVTERAILWILLNADMKLGYDDLSTILGKEKSTIRGQINTIKSKSEGLIEESIEKNGKKRVFIPEEIKEKMLKKQKVRVSESKNTRKYEKNEEKTT
jgi:predicted transcriptional regulator